MDINNFYKSLFEDTLGLDILGLESKFKELVELINRNTLFTFSDHIPCYYKLRLNPWDKNYIVDYDDTYYGIEFIIRDKNLKRFNLPILDVVECNYPDGYRNGYYGEIADPIRYGNIESILIGSEETYMRTMLDTALPFKPYYEYKGNDLIYFRNLPRQCELDITIKTVFPNIASIPEAYREKFKQLAMFDIKIKLWNELKYIEEIQTPSGNISLKISDWEGADKDRQDWLRDFRRESMPDRLGTMYFTIL